MTPHDAFFAGLLTMQATSIVSAIFDRVRRTAEQRANAKRQAGRFTATIRPSLN